MNVLTLVPHYLPGFKAGGPTRSIANLVAHLGDEFNFSIVTRDRDLGDLDPYPGVTHRAWQRVGKAQVAYLSPTPATWPWLIREIRRLALDAVYVNSFFDWQFALAPHVLAHGGLLRRVPLIIAPRGQFDPAALHWHRWKKRPFLAGFKAFGLHRRVLWHATCCQEQRDVRRLFGKSARVHIAPNISSGRAAGASSRRPKQPGSARFVYLSRISRKKNLAAAIDMLRTLPGRVTLDVWGPIDDAVYQRACCEQSAKLPAHATVTYRGPVAPDRVSATLAQYDALLLPTHGENFGHVIVEALAAGCPVVISDRTPWRGLAARGAGWDLPLDSRDAFQHALATITAMDESAHQAMRICAADLGRTIVRPSDAVAAHRNLFQAA